MSTIVAWTLATIGSAHADASAPSAVLLVPSTASQAPGTAPAVRAPAASPAPASPRHPHAVHRRFPDSSLVTPAPIERRAVSVPAPAPVRDHPPYLAPAPLYYDYAPGAYVAPPPAFVAPENGYWRYCPQLGAYYPDVTQCPVAWERVAAQ